MARKFDDNTGCWLAALPPALYRPPFFDFFTVAAVVFLAAAIMHRGSYAH